MERGRLSELLVEAERRAAADRTPLPDASRTEAAEGGCGVVGAASSVRVSGSVFLRSLEQMANRGNGKGGGVAVSGLDPAFLGVGPEVLNTHHLLAVAYLDTSVQEGVEREYVEPLFEVAHTFDVKAMAGDIQGVRPPDVRCYFVRVRADAREAFARTHGLEGADVAAVEDEMVYLNSYELNTAYYASTGEKRAFVLSHGKDLLVLKLVGYGDDVIRHYQLQDLRANVWIGHHRYPTKGTVWHPGGAHPFSGMHEALVHNGDFANYASVCSYLEQSNRHPLFLTDTEVAVLVFDLLHRVYDYPIEYVIEALAPTTERDFALLPADKQRVYDLIQRTHIHGSPDGPWFFLIAQSLADERRLIGITDTSMLRPQVFAMQQGQAGIGVAASEKQAIDAMLDSLSADDPRFWSRADRYWNARGGSHTDGGAFIFSVHGVENGATPTLVCTDKFRRVLDVDRSKLPPGEESEDAHRGQTEALALATGGLDAGEVFVEVRGRMAGWGYGDVRAFLDALVAGAGTDEARDRAFAVLALLLDRRYPTGRMKPSVIGSMTEDAVNELAAGIRGAPSDRYVWASASAPLAGSVDGDVVVVFDAAGSDAEGPRSLARQLVELVEVGARRIVVTGLRGQRFIGSGFGVDTDDVRLDLFGSSGDYLASGMDGLQIHVHGNAQDQLAQIMKAGKLVVHGDVGQTFGYAMKGGDVYILGSAAGRPLINAVGRPHVVINGTALDYLAESFMAGDPLTDGGFAIVNGVTFDEDGTLIEMDTPYPGGNLFSLASGGALYVRDPRGLLGVDQLNAGEFAPLAVADWDLIRPYLEENERHFGIPVQRLLTVDGVVREPGDVYRKIRPAAHHALTPEEAWVHNADQNAGQ
ncbi:MAG: glutamate synthase [Actinomycetota bacterium]